MQNIGRYDGKVWQVEISDPDNYHMMDFSQNQLMIPGFPTQISFVEPRLLGIGLRRRARKLLGAWYCSHTTSHFVLVYIHNRNCIQDQLLYTTDRESG
jgi:hypothetical protein